MQNPVATILKDQYSRIFAGLYNRYRNFELVEDAIQDAAERALASWPAAMPTNPGAWLFAVARNRILDLLKKSNRIQGLPEDWDPEDPQSVNSAAEEVIDRLDEQLRLMCLCCHPALARRSQTLLTLRLVGGLSVGEIAAALVMKPKTVAQYLTRAKAKIALAGIPFSTPDKSDLPARTDAIRDVLYLLFNEGYHSNSNHSLYRIDLCAEAIRLCRHLLEIPQTGLDSAALLAQMLFLHARSPARERSDGRPVLLDDQDRRLWNRSMIAEAGNLLNTYFRDSEFESPFLYQAAIAWEYTKSVDLASTNWAQVCLLYSRLYTLKPDPIVLLAWIGAEAYNQTPNEALRLMTEFRLESALSSYRWFYSVRAELRKRTGDGEGAANDLRRALEHAENPGERLLLTDRLKEVVDGITSGPSGPIGQVGAQPNRVLSEEGVKK